MQIELKAARENAGKTQAQVAKEAGISILAYQRYEHATRQPSVLTAVRIADAVGVTDYAQFKRVFQPAAPEE